MSSNQSFSPVLLYCTVYSRISKLGAIDRTLQTPRLCGEMRLQAHISIPAQSTQGIFPLASQHPLHTASQRSTSLTAQHAFSLHLVACGRCCRHCLSPGCGSNRSRSDFWPLSSQRHRYVFRERRWRPELTSSRPWRVYSRLPFGRKRVPSLKQNLGTNF